LLGKAFDCYHTEDLEIARVAAVVEMEGQGCWPRLREIMEFAERLGSRRVGLAFCVGLREEARICTKILESNGFEVRSAICKTGSVEKKAIGVNNELHPAKFEPMCNPIAQAALLEEAGCQLHIILGLCVGHDTLYFKHAKVPVTVLAVKDRVLAHNPLGAIYAGHFYGNKLKNVIKKKD
jgi:uncharacterized metal-binding protein